MAGIVTSMVSGAELFLAQAGTLAGTRPHTRTRPFSRTHPRISNCPKGYLGIFLPELLYDFRLRLR